MAVTPGGQLGAYSVRELIGAGGMGEVYLGQDARLNRSVVSEKAGAIEFGIPKFLFDMPANVFNTRNSYIPSRDGKRFLINTLLDADEAPINVVQNWRMALQ